MSRRENFGKQLTALCKSEESISGICRALGINRQQFSRYTAGKAVPNDRNLEKIARYFQVAQSDLFREPEPHMPSARKIASRNEISERIFEIAQNEQPSSLAPGNYYATFGYPQDPNVVVRSVVIVRRKDNMTVFRRLTGFAEPRDTWWSLYTGDHRGIVIDRRQLVHFIGLNSAGHQEPSFITMNWTTSEWTMLVGHASIIGTNGPIISPVVITPCDERTSLRAAIRNSHVYSTDDPKIESVVIDMLAEKGTAMAQMLRPLDLSVQALGGGSKASKKIDQSRSTEFGSLDAPR